jgi:hypothetical protein
MMKKLASSLYVVLLPVALLVVAPSLANAQYKPRPLNDPATGETYHIEAVANLWFPTTTIRVSSENLGQPPTLIDAKSDLGLQDKRLPEFRLVLRPSTRNKFRFQYIPIRYEQTAAPQRDIVYNGQRYQVNVPVNSEIDWQAYRLGYEFDFITTNRGYGGFILEAKYTDVSVRLRSPVESLDEFTRAQGPIPGIGGIVRIYVVPNISITGEVTGFKLPKTTVLKDASGHYVDFDLYATLNFTRNIGVHAGYRAIDAGYVVKADTGLLILKGGYFGVVARY